mmetsp:Transcript_14076/g.39881  ORF Transcript_14076/g.39881 Transcript_14076/m.39881 type:complete len:272 (-) Transcript_14076:210-1025(-)
MLVLRGPQSEGRAPILPVHCVTRRRMANYLWGGRGRHSDLVLADDRVLAAAMHSKETPKRNRAHELAWGARLSWGWHFHQLGSRAIESHRTRLCRLTRLATDAITWAGALERAFAFIGPHAVVQGNAEVERSADCTAGSRHDFVITGARYHQSNTRLSPMACLVGENVKAFGRGLTICGSSRTIFSNGVARADFEHLTKLLLSKNMRVAHCPPHLIDIVYVENVCPVAHSEACWRFRGVKCFPRCSSSTGWREPTLLFRACVLVACVVSFA